METLADRGFVRVGAGHPREDERRDHHEQQHQRRDYPVIQGTLLVIAAIYVLINLLVDLLYTVADPRIRLEGK